MPANRLVGYFLEGPESFTAINIGPFTLTSLAWITEAHVRGGLVWNATDVADYGFFPAFVTGLQYGASGYTPWAINDADGYNSWLWLRHCKSSSTVTWLDTVADPNVIAEHDSLDNDWYGQLDFSGDTDFYVSVAVSPLNESGVTGAQVIGSVEWMRD